MTVITTAIVWGVLGLLIGYIGQPFLNKLLAKLSGKQE